MTLIRGRDPVFWIKASAAVLCVAAFSGMLGLPWHQDVLFLIHLVVSVRAFFGVTTERAGHWTWASSFSLLGITVLALAGTYQGYSYGLYNRFWFRDQSLWITPALVVANYIVTIAIVIRSRWLATAGERRLARARFVAGGLALQFVWMAAGWFFIWMMAPQYVRLVERKTVSPTRVYEKWIIDYGGSGGYDCRVYDVQTIGLIARYKRIDPDRTPSPIRGGCGM